jgi:hypothetical protein
VQQAPSGRLVRVGPGRFRLELRAPADTVTAFSDRPRRVGGRERLRDFLSSWGRRGFRASPPNAALVIANAPPQSDIVLLTLSSPRLARGRLVYDARALRGPAPRGLAAVSSGADPARDLDFGRASLFIDSAVDGRAVDVSVTLSGDPSIDLYDVELTGGAFIDLSSATAGFTTTGGASVGLINFTSNGFELSPVNASPPAAIQVAFDAFVPNGSGPPRLSGTLSFDPLSPPLGSYRVLLTVGGLPDPASLTRGPWFITLPGGARG